MELAHFQFDPDTDRLGEGPLSEVYKAVDTQLGRTVALKILRAHAEIDPQADKRFHREAKHASSLEHPNIATIYEYGRDHGTSFIAMEFLQGRTLDKIIKDQLLGYEECLRIGVQLASALAVVHKADLIHRDLKPGNILIQDDGSVKLLDFGIARARDEASITQVGMLVGTVLYMSPEQVRGDKLDFRSDIFALGAVLYNVMTGTLPFPGESFPEVCMAILDGTPAVRPSEVRSGFPPLLEEFLLKCMQVEPAGRFPNAEVAYRELTSIANALTGTSTRPRATLSGHLLIAPLRCQTPGSDACDVMAGSIRKDLATELARDKGLEVTLLEDDRLPAKGGYDYLLKGALSLEGKRGRLELELSLCENGESGPRLSKTFRDVCEHEDDDEWTLQADLVRNARRVVRRRLTEASVEPTGAGQRNIAEAQQLAIQARTILHRGTTKHLLAASSRFRRAMELDRFCAEAHAGMAEALVRKFLYWDGEPSFLDEARDYAGRALALDRECAEAHTALGFAFQLAGRPAEAQREYRLAIQASTHEWLAHRLLGAILAREGNFKHASPLLQRAIGLKPEHIPSYDHLHTVLQRLDRYEEALEIADKGIAAAHKQLTRAKDDQETRLHMGTLQARLGQHDQARTAVEEARQVAPKDGYTAFHSACVFAVMGDPSDAMEALKLAQARGYFVKTELLPNTDLDILRGLPEFDDLIA